MNGRRLLLIIVMLLLAVFGGNYLADHWTRLQSAGVPAPAAPSATVTSGAEATGPAVDRSVGATSGDTLDQAAETRMRKPFDAAAADAAAEAEARATTGTARSIAPAQVGLGLDAVELSATGMSVVAGEAPAGAEVTLLANERALAKAVADAAGTWTMLIETPLAPGTYELKLSAVVPVGGAAVVREVGTVSVSAPAGVMTGTGAGETSSAAAPPEATARADVSAAPAGGQPADTTIVASAASKVAPVTDIDVPASEQKLEGVPPDLIAAATVEASEAGGSATSAATETAAPDATQQGTQTAQAETAPEADPSLADRAGAAADALSDMFTDWLSASSEQADKAAETFTLSAVTYEPLAPGRGALTLSGEGPASAKVKLFVDGRPVGTTEIAEDGLWQAEAEHWVPPGEHVARAEILGPDGAVLLGRDMAFTSRALPDVVASAPAAADEAAAPVRLTIATVAYESMGPKQGRITVAGMATPGATVAVSADGKVIGTAIVASDGAWRLVSDTWFDVGAHDIGAERVDATGAVAERMLTQFVRPADQTRVAAVDDAPPPPAIEAAARKRTAKPAKRAKRRALRKRSRLAARQARLRQSAIARAPAYRIVRVSRGSAVTKARVKVTGDKRGGVSFILPRGPGWYRVRRGDSLWRIARRFYGDGRSYPVILANNRHRIRNPDLIWPHQRLVVP